MARTGRWWREWGEVCSVWCGNGYLWDANYVPSILVDTYVSSFGLYGNDVDDLNLQFTAENTNA